MGFAGIDGYRRLRTQRGEGRDWEESGEEGPDGGFAVEASDGGENGQGAFFVHVAFGGVEERAATVEGRGRTEADYFTEAVATREEIFAEELVVGGESGLFRGMSIRRMRRIRVRRRSRGRRSP